jgi:DNA anti-recombination protein RmuC
MADEPENHTLRLLREMREETNRRFDEMREEANRRFNEIREGTNHRFDGMREEQAAFRADVIKGFDGLNIAVATLSADLKLTKATVESIQETQKNHGIRLKNQGTRLNAIEGRLAIIEKNASLVEA